VSRRPIAWSAREKPIVEAALRALLAGEYVTVRDAAGARMGHLPQFLIRITSRASGHARRHFRLPIVDCRLAVRPVR